MRESPADARPPVWGYLAAADELDSDQRQHAMDAIRAWAGREGHALQNVFLENHGSITQYQSMLQAIGKFLHTSDALTPSIVFPVWDHANARLRRFGIWNRRAQHIRDLSMKIVLLR